MACKEALRYHFAWLPFSGHFIFRCLDRINRIYRIERLFNAYTRGKHCGVWGGAPISILLVFIIRANSWNSWFASPSPPMKVLTTNRTNSRELRLVGLGAFSTTEEHGGLEGEAMRSVSGASLPTVKVCLSLPRAALPLH